MAVYVKWYGKMLQGEVVENNCPGILSKMVAVRIPIQGMHATALFSSEHVFSSPEQTSEDLSVKAESAPKLSDGPKVSSDWQRVQQFKNEHWDAARNHLRLDALEEFYRIWRDAVAKKKGVKIEKTNTDFRKILEAQPKPTPEILPIAYKPAKPINVQQLTFFDL